MKKFAEVENNASIAGFLQNNYGRNNNSDLFDELKSASSQKELTKGSAKSAAAMLSRPWRNRILP